MTTPKKKAAKKKASNAGRKAGVSDFVYITPSLFAAVRDLVGGRSAAYERELGKAREIALAELEDWADEVGANAVIGVNIDYESFGQTNGMMMVSATGTAVIIDRP